MKPTISNLTEALVWQLNELYDAETKLKAALPHCSNRITSPSLKKEVTRYVDRCEDQLIKLERVYNYLMKEPGTGRSKIIDRLIDNTNEILQSYLSDEMRDVMLISCMHTINHYKIAVYSTAATFARELELDTGADLLEEILKWERQMDINLTKIAIYQVNVKAKEYNT